MLQIRRDLDLGEEPLDAEDRAELGAQDLEGDLCRRESARGTRSPSLADFPVDLIRRTDACLELGGEIAHVTRLYIRKESQTWWADLWASKTLAGLG